MPTDLIGPFSSFYKVVVDGYLVPHLTASPVDAKQTEWELCIDGRFALTVNQENINQFTWFIANAMAVAAGYSAHGANCQAINKYMVRLAELPSDFVAPSENPSKDDPQS